MLIETLKHIQARDNLTDKQFARNIGIHRVSWQRIKNRRKPFGKKFLKLIRKAYPELKDAIDIFLSTDATSIGNEVTIISDTPQTPLQRLGALIKKVIRKGGDSL